MAHHRCRYRIQNKCSNQFSSSALSDELGIENCKIELLESYSCSSKEEMLKREGEYIRSMDCVNKQIAGRSKTEYKKEFNQWHKAKDRNYYQSNKDKLEKYKEQYECEWGAVLSIHHHKPRQERTMKHQNYKGLI